MSDNGIDNESDGGYRKRLIKIERMRKYRKCIERCSERY